MKILKRFFILLLIIISLPITLIELFEIPIIWVFTGKTDLLNDVLIKILYNLSKK